MITCSLRIDEFCETGAGGTPSRARPEFYGNGIPWVKSGELRDGVVEATEECVTKEGVRAARLRVVPKGSLLVAMYGATVGRTALLGIDATTNQAVCQIRPDPSKADTRYLWYALKAKLPELLAKRVGGAQPNISQETIRATRIILPTLIEQRRIADILDKADAVRRKRKEAIALTEELLRSAFLEMFGDPVTNPKGWPIEPLGNYLGFITSGSRGWAEHYTVRGERFIRSLDVQMDRITDEDAAYVSAPTGAEAERTRVQQDDVLLTITGSRIGRAARATTQHAGSYVSQHVAILRVLSGLDADVLAAFLVSDRGGQALITRTQYGQTKPGLNLAQIRAFPIPVPSGSVQKQIRVVRSRLRASQERLIETARVSEDLFASLINEAFSRGIQC